MQTSPDGCQAERRIKAIEKFTFDDRCLVISVVEGKETKNVSNHQDRDVITMDFFLWTWIGNFQNLSG